MRLRTAKKVLSAGPSGHRRATRVRAWRRVESLGDLRKERALAQIRARVRRRFEASFHGGAEALYEALAVAMQGDE